MVERVDEALHQANLYKAEAEQARVSRDVLNGLKSSPKPSAETFSTTSPSSCHICTQIAEVSAIERSERAEQCEAASLDRLGEVEAQAVQAAELSGTKLARQVESGECERVAAAAALQAKEEEVMRLTASNERFEGQYDRTMKQLEEVKGSVRVLCRHAIACLHPTAR